MGQGEDVRERSRGKKGVISILVCSRGRRRDLENLVNTLKRAVTKRQFEIVAVEETDEADPIGGIRYIAHPVANRGIPYARNLALANARGEIVVFLDDDCVIHEGWLDNLLKPFNDASIVGVQGGVCVPRSTNVIGWAESILGVPGGGITRVWQAKGRVEDTREISTLNCAYRRWVIDKIGGFERRLKITGEDYIFAKQACDYGRCVFVPDAMASHKARGTLRKIWHWFVRRGRAEVAVILTGKQQDTTFWTVFKGSLTVKLLILIAAAVAFSDWIGFLIASCFSAYIFLQYARYNNAWRFSKAPLMALVLLPLVKVTMDMAVDWGRFRGLIFD